MEAPPLRTLSEQEFIHELVREMVGQITDQMFLEHLEKIASANFPKLSIVPKE